ncbi:MAG: DEAD/DEAH box helicase family protein [bacterium]|nr:DEAD/DEAH box helicase family protein [bacterium]
MRFHFDPNLQFQLDAIHAVVRLFEGAPHIRPQDRIFAEVIANKIDISSEQVLTNRTTIMSDNRIADGKPTDALDFSIEMETGTGKTYVYLRTIFELHRAYGLTKFIIVVPSVAVREGVLKTIEVTREHFRALFHAMPFEAFPYDGKHLNRVKHFAISNALQIMVMNMQAFNAEDRIINQERDTLYGERLIDLIQRTAPVLILDEPQEGMDTPNMVERRAALHPLCTLRYSATHRVLTNLLYRLTPYDAYRQGLVKKIEVYPISEEGTQSDVRIAFTKAVFSAKAPKAKLMLAVRTASSELRDRVVTVKFGDDLATKTKNPVYTGWIVERISKDMGSDTAKIAFTNGTEITEQAQHGRNREAIFREQIRYAIRSHFEKKDALAPRGIKALALFFIDRVANYNNEDGIIRRLFRELYVEEWRRRYHRDPEHVDAVHEGYFAKTGGGDWTDSETSMRKNSEAYDLILRNKERLLSTDEPVEFIFSHSALGVGWDNPNVFTICTLNETESIMKKRQEIGRGLRICVDQNGERVFDLAGTPEGKEVNLLTVVANESYHAFAEGLQRELVEEYGEGVEQVPVRNKRAKPTRIQLNRDQYDSEHFRQLWERIAPKTTYEAFFREEELVARGIAACGAIVVPRPQIIIERRRIRDLGDIAAATYEGDDRVAIDGSTAFVNPVVALVADTALSTVTVQRIVDGLTNTDQLARNPLVYLAEAAQRLKRILAEELVAVIRYQPTNEQYPLADLEKIEQTYQQTVSVRRSIYDHVIYDSETIERPFALALDGEQRVRVFLKLPNWYAIATPIGDYHPDWAFVVEQRELDDGGESRSYLVVETKGSNDLGMLRPDEQLKIKCALAHFTALGFAPKTDRQYIAPIKDFKSLRSRALDANSQPIL